MDNAAIEQYVEHALLPSLFRELRQMPPNAPIGRREDIVVMPFATAQADGSGNVPVTIHIGSRDRVRSGKPVLGGNIAPGRGGNQIYLDLNGDAPPGAFLSEEGLPMNAGRSDHRLAYGIYSALIHELTHSADLAFGQKGPDYHTDDGVDWVKYANNDMESRAFMQQIVDQAINLARNPSLRSVASRQRNRNEALVDLCLEEQQHWGRVAPDMSQKTRNKVLLAVTRALDDAGLLFP